MAQEVAKEILRQLGGNRFVAMTGSKNFVADEKSLTMRLTRNKLSAMWLTITLSKDYYTMTFTKSKKVKDATSFTGKNEVLVTLSEIEGIGFDQLQSIFTEKTGLYTHI
jgi:hypothetical protein